MSSNLCGLFEVQFTQSDVFWVWFSEVQLVGQEGQAPPGGFVSDLIYNISQCIDVPANILQDKPQTILRMKFEQ